MVGTTSSVYVHYVKSPLLASSQQLGVVIRPLCLSWCLLKLHARQNMQKIFVLEL